MRRSSAAVAHLACACAAVMLAATGLPDRASAAKIVRVEWVQYGHPFEFNHYATADDPDPPGHSYPSGPVKITRLPPTNFINQDLPGGLKVVLALEQGDKLPIVVKVQDRQHAGTLFTGPVQGTMMTNPAGERVVQMDFVARRSELQKLSQDTTRVFDVSIPGDAKTATWKLLTYKGPHYFAGNAIDGCQSPYNVPTSGKIAGKMAFDVNMASLVTRPQGQRIRLRGVPADAFDFTGYGAVGNGAYDTKVEHGTSGKRLVVGIRPGFEGPAKIELFIAEFADNEGVSAPYETYTKCQTSIVPPPSAPVKKKTK